MSNPHEMAPSQPPPHRPPFPHQGSSYRSDHGMPNGRPSPVNAQSSPQTMTYSSPSPQYSPSNIYPPAAKRQRLSEEPTQAFSPPNYPQTPGGQVRSPGVAQPTNGFLPPPPRPGSMAPPQRPAERNKEDENYEDVLAGTGINVEEEERNLARPDYYSHNSFQNPYPNRQGSFSNQHNSLGQMASNGALQRHQDGQFRPAIPEPSPEERLQRQEARADWDAARHSQNPLWDMFLYGGTLNDRIRKISLRERLHDPQSGVLVNTQRTGPPPVARVNGLEGATRVIGRGQAILDSENKGQRLSEIMKLVCLATKTRVTGLLSASARLSIERRQHSKGQVPDEWLDIAALHKASSEPAEMGASAEAAPSLKRTHSQANDESGAAGATRIATAMQRVAKADREAEEARRAKRARRNAPNASTPQDIEAAAAAELLAVAADAEKKTTKKERKQAENRLSEAQQHKSANEAVRMAVGMGGGLLGGKKKKTYGWMNAGASGTSTPTRPVGSTTTSAAGTPSQDKTRQQTAKQKRFGTWDEDKDPGIQVRDVLPVLESDGMAPRAYIRGCERLDT